MITLALAPTTLEEATETGMLLSVTNVGSRPCTGLRLRVAIPDNVLVVDGRTTLRIDRLDPGQPKGLRLRVRAATAGVRTVTVTGYSYTDGNLGVQRPTVAPWTLTVLPRSTPDHREPTAPQAPRDTVFLCYRRNDTGELADVLYDALRVELGPNHVFIDTSGVELGADFQACIDMVLDRSTVTLVLIGPGWRPERLAEERDSVHHEILTSLNDVPWVLPILTRGASMPPESRVPADVTELTRLNAFVIHSDTRRADIERLVEVVIRWIRHRGR